MIIIKARLYILVVLITLVVMVTLACTGDDLHDSGCIELEYIDIGGPDNPELKYTLVNMITLAW